jgi:maltose alpha-D-glucosyltransferase/alpha-amylase
MQWNDEKNAGFSKADKKNIYLPIDEDENRTTVEKCEADENSLLHKTGKLIKIRTSEKALEADAALKIIFAEENTYPFIFSREKNNEKILCIFNPADREVEVTFDFNFAVEKLHLLAGSAMKIQQEGEKAILAASACSYAIYKVMQ